MTKEATPKRDDLDNKVNRVFAGKVVRKDLVRKVKVGANVPVFVLEDLQGSVEVVLFPDVLNKYGDLLVEDTVVFAKGKLDHKREKPNILAVELITLDKVTEKLAAKVRIKLDAKDVTKEKIATIKSICRHHKGRSPVYVAIRTDKGRVHAKADNQLSVDPDLDFCRKMRQLVGPENFQLTR